MKLIRSMLALALLLSLVSSAVALASCEAALLVVDVQKLYLSWQPWQTAIDEPVLSGVARAIERARDAEVPVIYIQESYPYNLELDDKLPPELAFPDEIKPSAGDQIFRKNVQNAFSNPALSEHLEEEGITRLLVCGIASNACVLGTVNAAIRLGYEVTIVGDAHSEMDGTAEASVYWNQTYERMGVPAPLSCELDWSSFSCEP